MERVYDLLEKAEEMESAASSQGSEAGSQLSQGSQSGSIKVEAGTPEPTLTATPTVTASSGMKILKKRKSVLSRMAGEVQDLTQPAENFRKEVGEYLGSSVRIDQTVLDWWKTHEVTFPNVAKLAKAYLSIPPTEVNITLIMNSTNMNSSND